MANQITIVEKYSKLIDEKNKSEFAFQSLVDESAKYDATTSKFRIPYADLGGGIGTYDKNSSDPFATSSVTTGYQDVETDYDLGGQIIVDSADEIDSDNIALAGGTNALMDKYVSIRNAMTAAKICEKATKKVEETITDAETFYKALRTGTNYMADHKVKPKKCILYTTEGFYASLMDMDTIKSKDVLSKFNEIKIMTPDEFVSSIKVNTGRDGSFDYSKNAGAKQINFMIVDTNAIFTKDDIMMKNITATENQNGFSHKFQLRFRGVSAYVLRNKADNVYVSYAAE